MMFMKKGRTTFNTDLRVHPWRILVILTIVPVMTTLYLNVVCVDLIKAGPNDSPSLMGRKDVSPELHYSNKTNMINIIYWNTFRGFANYSFGFGNMPFIQAKCKVSNCNTTFSKDHAEDADAILFHIADLGKRRHWEAPKVRLPHQKYVFFVRESPVYSHLNMSAYNNFFNISMTYSQDADVNFPYGILKKRTNAPYVPYDEQHVKSKTKFAIGLISNCGGRSKRMILINALRKYIPIDIFGKCGTGKNNRSTVHQCFNSYDADCSRRLISKYKFYLAFENSMCRDYITEKLYKVMDLPLVPVVYGGANYSALLPKHSYINVRDFKGIHALVNHLSDVASNSTKYLSYFEWRREYQQVATSKLLRTVRGDHDFLQLEPQAMCNLCEYLHKHRSEEKTISDLEAFWGKERNCFSPKTWLKHYISM